MKDSRRSIPSEVAECLKTFRKVLPWKLKLHEIGRQMHSTEVETCLDIGANHGGISYYLRKKGGKWSTVVTNRKAYDLVRRVVGSDVHLMQDGQLPFKKNTFDVVVIVDLLEITDSDSDFIQECHRVMKTDGHLVINVARSKPWSLINTMRRMLARELGKDPEVYVGYTESELFSLLKHGFDVYTVRTYSRFFLEFVNMFVRMCVVRFEIGDSGVEREASIERIYSFARIFYWIADQLDILLFFTKGHHMLASAKRRAWRSREAPVLVDGRTITEAVLSPLK